MAEPEVPEELNRLWRLSPQSRMGRPAELDVECVVRTAVEIADTEGLAAVTLSRIAKSLGYTTMSLYRHVGSKDELYGLMKDLATGEPPQPVAPDWRSGLRQWAHALYTRYVERSWLALLPVSGPPNGPNAIAWLDAGLRTLRDTELDWETRAAIMTLLSEHVRSSTRLAAELAAGRKNTGRTQEDVEQAYGRVMTRLVDPERFPDAAQLFGSNPWETSSPAPGEQQQDPEFTFGLELILDGIAATIGPSA